jgi:hypothetical protein
LVIVICDIATATIHNKMDSAIISPSLRKQRKQIAKERKIYLQFRKSAELYGLDGHVDIDQLDLLLLGVLLLHLRVALVLQRVRLDVDVV